MYPSIKKIILGYILLHFITQLSNNFINYNNEYLFINFFPFQSIIKTSLLQ